MLGNSEKYLYWVFVPGVLSYLGYYVYTWSLESELKKYAHLKDFEKEFLAKGVRKLEHDDMKIYVVGIDNEEDP